MILDVILLSLLAFLGTCVGAALAFFTPPKLKERPLDAMLGFAGGVMLALTFLELLAPSIEEAGALQACFAFLLGLATLFALDFYVPHIHARLMKRRQPGPLVRLATLVAIGMALHSAPEGLALGAGYVKAPPLGLMIALAIAAHNVPEGLVVSMPLRASGWKALSAFLVGALPGLTEPLFAVIGALLLLGAPPEVLAMALAFAAGAMLYITCDELIPESHAHGYEHEATLALTLGILYVIALAAALGI